MQPDTRKKQTTKIGKKVTLTDIMLIAHEHGVFVITHPRSSDVMILDQASFQKMTQIEGEKWIDLMKTAEYECKEHRSFSFPFDDYSIMFTKALDLVGVYGAFRKPKIFVNGVIDHPSN